MDTNELIAVARPKIGALGSAFYFTPETVAVGKGRGLDGFRFYVLGRGGVLGDVHASVVSSAFGWWNPETIEKIWNSGREVMGAREAGALYMTCAQDLGKRKFGDVAGLAEFCASAEKILAAVDDAGLSLYAGIAAEPLAEDLPSRAMQLVAVLREYRGSVHLLAVVASGLSPRLAHAIKRPDMFKAFGWGEDVPDSTDADRAKLDAAEVLTDQLVHAAFGVLSPAEADSFVATLDACSAALQ